MKSNCKHKFEISHVAREFPQGFSGTSASIEYAYLLCHKCTEVIKKEVKHEE